MSQGMSNIEEVAERLKSMRELMELSVSDMAEVSGLTDEEYIAHEQGLRDFSISMLYKCAQKFGIDVT